MQPRWRWRGPPSAKLPQRERETRRLADARALHTALLRQLAGATTTQQISIQAQIHDAERSISSGESALGSLNHRIAFSDVSDLA